MPVDADQVSPIRPSLISESFQIIRSIVIIISIMQVDAGLQSAEQLVEGASE